MNPYSNKIKQTVRSLRRNKGLSYGVIAKELAIAKSTIRLWCGDINLKPEFKEKLYTERINRLTVGPNSSHQRREREINSIVNNAEKEIQLPISQESYKLIGAALYWAEGSKTIDFSLINSDPLLIRFIVQWIKDVLHIHPQNLKAHLNIYPQQNEVEIKKFWSKITEIPIGNFGKSFVKPLGKGYKKNNLYHGTIKIRTKNGSDIRHRISGWINAVLKDNKIKINEKVIWNKKNKRS